MVGGVSIGHVPVCKRMREAVGADTVLETAPSSNQNFELLLKYWPGRHHKQDKDGCLVYYERLGAVGTHSLTHSQHGFASILLIGSNLSRCARTAVLCARGGPYEHAYLPAGRVSGVVTIPFLEIMWREGCEQKMRQNEFRPSPRAAAAATQRRKRLIVGVLASDD